MTLIINDAIYYTLLMTTVITTTTFIILHLRSSATSNSTDGSAVLGVTNTHQVVILASLCLSGLLPLLVSRQPTTLPLRVPGLLLLLLLPLLLLLLLAVQSCYC